MTQATHRPFIILIFSFLILLTASSSLKAEEETDSLYQPRTSRYDTMKKLKDDIAVLIAENKKLEERYSQLKEEWQLIQDQSPSSQKEVIQNNPESLFPTKINAGQENFDPYIDDKNLDSQKRYLSGELMDYSEQLSLLQLHLADLQYQRRELELELKLNKVQNQDKERKALELKEAENIALQQALQKERQLLEEITRREEELRTTPEQVSVLEKENQDLEEKAVSLAKKKEFKEKELSILKDKKMLKEKSTAQSLSKAEKEKSDLKNQVEDLKKQHDQLSNQITTSLGRQDRRNELIQGIKKYDLENQKLRTQIDEMSLMLKRQE
ncbi:MAG: hypothetical protein KBD53_00575 [Candidatus Omnitrophica bacterium]|nr:hypothetical protein [Candidatus Omnitrophota bacterium]